MAPRPAVLWVGSTPPKDLEKVLQQRRLNLLARKQVSDVDLQSARSLIFAAVSAGSLHKVIDEYARRALDHGLQVMIHIDLASQALLQSRYPDFNSRWTYFDPPRGLEDLAEVVRAHDPGPPENPALVVPPVAPSLNPEDELLLRRAFSDCDEITISPIPEDKSAARVLRVHAKLAGGDPPSYLLPFLVKIDGIEPINGEMDRYRKFVAGHIPFTQRPNLDPGRCLAGSSRAVMVSDFVEDAVSLSKICDRPEGRRVVYSLFDDGLRSWRRHAEAAVPSPPLPITDHLMELAGVDRITAAVRARARTLGARRTPEQLLDDLCHNSTHAWKLGIIHGDLHPGNVMVRAGEAILIDFASIWDTNKPLIADLACLEVGMCFTVAAGGCVKSLRRTGSPFAEWRKTVDLLFGRAALRRVPTQQGPYEFGWLWESCRQTRSMAAQLEASPAAYACALALYLLRRARLGGGASENPTVEAYALVTAERIIRALKSRQL